jgi:hypothetical protein
MYEHDYNIRIDEEEEVESPAKKIVNKVDATLFEIANNLDQIEQDTHNTVTLTSEDKADVINQVDEEHHQIFLSMNKIRGVDIDEFCGVVPTEERQESNGEIQQ